jgi:DNA-binding NarL/FixJ family response regulator
MEAGERISVAILYRHQLFGEGIAHFLAGEPDVMVESIPIGVDEASTEALAPDGHPDVVIFERAAPDAAVELLGAFPDALVIDVAMDAGPTYAWRREVIGSQPESIVGTIRGFARPPTRPPASGPLDIGDHRPVSRSPAGSGPATT